MTTDATPGTVPVTDRRTPPRGVLPRGAQTWLMAAIALGILLVIVLTGQPQPARPAGPTAPSPLPLAPNADRVRDYEARLRLLNERARQEVVQAEHQTGAPPTPEKPASATSQDSVETDRRRRAYESLFASNVVVSRRPDAQQPAGAREAPRRGARTTDDALASPPNLDDVANAVLRATTHSQAIGTTPPVTPPITTQASSSIIPSTGQTRPPAHTDPISAAGPLHRLLEGTVMDTVLTNRLDGSSASPVNCLVTNPMYSYSGQQVLIPAGTRVLGETKPVQNFGETRLAIAFHRLLFPNGSTQSLEQFKGLNQIGDAGLHDQVNQHYLSTFGAAAAVGLIGGLAQYVGTAGLGNSNRNGTVVIAGGMGQATTDATMQIMSRFLNRLPTITIREGTRVKVYLTSDLELPAYGPPGLTGDRP
jgi:type IV secretory pathway VirB10-like protein